VVAATVTTVFFVPESPIKAPGRVNWLGATLLSAWLICLLLGISDGSARGWGDARVVGLIAAAAVLLGLWVRNEQHADEPLVDMRMMRIRGVWTVNAAAFLVGAGMCRLTVWFTGLPAAGKTTLARGLRAQLADESQRPLMLDGDDLRRGLSADLNLSPEGRRENVRRAAAVAVLLAGQGAIVLVSLVSPYRADRDAARRLHEQAQIPFAEVWVATPADECARRDVKDLYRRAAAGELTGLTGHDAPYERPLRPEAVLIPTPQDNGVAALERFARELRG